MTVEVVVDILWHDFLSITTKVKLPLRDDVVRVVTVVGNQGDLTDVSSMSEYNISRPHKRVSQAMRVFLCDEVVSQLIKVKPTEMVATDNGNAGLRKCFNFDVRAKGSHSDLFGNSFNGQCIPTRRDFTEFAFNKIAVCERLKVHKPRLKNSLCDLF
jgi:hypothetical protein